MEWPTTAADITPEWLSGALAPLHPGADVDAVEVVERHELTNAHARLRVSYRTSAGAPVAMFCKLPPTDARREQIIASGMGQREARFYADLAPSVGMRVPDAHVALTDDDGMFAILLEDLVTTGGDVSDGTWGVPVDAAAGAIEDLAALHIRFDDQTRRAAEAPWVQVSKPSASYGATMLRYGIDHHRDRLTDAFVEIAELYIAHHDELQVLWHEGPPTVIHGDPHIGNLFLDDGRVGFLDWGIINVNTPMRDISYFLTMAMQIEDRRAHERDLLRFYLDLRRAAGVSEISFDDAWRAHRIHASYNVPASCQVVMFPEDMTERRRVFSNAFLDRAQASLDDLEARDALREAIDR
jgi:aminoglycoside phosphotransferase (APT) family kinase protein